MGGTSTSTTGTANSADLSSLLGGISPSALQGGGTTPTAGPPLQAPMFNPNAMYDPQNQVPVTQTAQTGNTALPASLNSQNPNNLSPTMMGAVGGYSPLTMSQQAPQQKMGANNASMK